MTYDVVYTENKRYYLPDREIKADDATYIYAPLRGYFASLAVFDIDDKPIGWIKAKTLGFESVRAWMEATRYEHSLQSLTY